MCSFFFFLHSTAFCSSVNWVDSRPTGRLKIGASRIGMRRCVLVEPNRAVEFRQDRTSGPGIAEVKVTWFSYKRNLRKWRTSLGAEGTVCGGFDRDNELLVQKLTAEDCRLLKVQLLLTVPDFRRFESLHWGRRTRVQCLRMFRAANFSEFPTIITRRLF